MELVVVSGIEGAGALCEPATREVDQFFAAEVEFDCRFQGDFEIVKRLDYSSAIFSSVCVSLRGCFLPGGSKLVVELLGIGVLSAGLEEFAVDVEVANGAGGAAEFAEGSCGEASIRGRCGWWRRRRGVRAWPRCGGWRCGVCGQVLVRASSGKRRSQI